MAEHGVADGERVIGFAFDGTGYGSDGAIWGGEVLVAGYDGFDRVAHLRYVPLPGGDAAIRKPYRVALAHLWAAGIEWDADLAPVRIASGEERRVLQRQLERGIHCVPTSSAGRLFDAVSSLLGIRHVVSYEAQAAIELETVADAHLGSACDYRIAIGGDDIDVTPVLRAMIDDLRAGRAPGAIAAGFHVAAARLIAEIADDLRVRTGLDRVALSGGVFQNALLVRLARAQLAGRGFTVLTHRVVPPNDGGLALGQVAVAGRASHRGGARVNDRDVPGLADDLAAGALALARRFAGGATMWCISPRWPAHGRHVAVEFVHPVIVGKRALPAVSVDCGDIVGAVRLLARPGDVILAIGPAGDEIVGSLLRRAPAWGLTSLWLGAGPRPPAGTADHVIWIDGDDAGIAARSGDVVMLYHLLWELTHVVFEHPGLLEVEPACTDDVCITCSDEGRTAESRSCTRAGVPKWWPRHARNHRHQPGRRGHARRPRPGPCRRRTHGARGARIVTTEPTGFLYPFIDADERDAGALLVDLAASAEAKMAESKSLPQGDAPAVRGHAPHRRGGDGAPLRARRPAVHVRQWRQRH